MALWRFRRNSDSQAARLLRGEPEALLIVEFDEDNPVDNTRQLKALADLVAEADRGKFAVIEILGENARAALWRLRREALAQTWTLKSAAQPATFLEDGAVPLQSLAAYGEPACRAFGALWPCVPRSMGRPGAARLQIRPVLDLQQAQDRKKMRSNCRTPWPNFCATTRAR